MVNSVRKSLRYHKRRPPVTWPRFLDGQLGYSSGMAPSRTTLIAAALALTAIAGCSVAPSTPRTVTSGARIDVDSHTLLAQIALEEQRLDAATDHYVNAAEASLDPAISERAARMAASLGLIELGQRAVARWRDLEPMAEGPDYFAGVFETGAGRVTNAIENFSRFVDAGHEAQQGTRIAEILPALGDESNPLVATAVMAGVTERFPDTVEGHYGLAQLAIRSGNFDLALNNAQAATELAPDWRDAKLLYARALLVAGHTEDSLELAASLAETENDLETRLQYAELLLSAGENEQAEALLNSILADNPGMPEAIRALAFSAMTRGELETATEHFETLRAESSYRNEAFYYLGRIAENEEDALRAIRAYARVTEGSQAVEAQIRTSVIMYSDMGDPEGALRHLREFGNASPQFRSEMLLAEGQLLLQMGEPQRAVQLLEDAIAENPNNPEPALSDAHIQFYAALAQDAVNRNNLDEADNWLDEGLSRYPGDTTLRYSRALLLQEQGRLRKAVGVLEKLVADRPDNAALLNALGYLLTDKFDRHDEARGYIQRALAMNPDSAAIIDSMGWVLFRLGDYEAALDYLERAHRLMDDPEVVAHLVDVHWALGDRDTALQMLEEALSTEPDDPHLNEVSQRLRQ